MKNTGTGRKTRRHYKSPVTHVFLSIIYSSFFPSYYGGDTMVPGQSITGNQTLTSSGEIFELGFFTPSNSNNSYIGIWYNKISPKTVVWIANRDNPLGDSSNGALKFGRDGNLNLVDEKTGEIYWSTSVPSVGESEANKSVVVISYSGNLILRRTDITQITETHVWQSFDYPCDVLLPGMKVGLNLKTGKNLSLISWRSTDDPSSGTSVLGIDGVNLDQIVIRQKDGLHWRSGSWNGEGFDGLPEMKRTNTGNYSFFRDGDWIYFSYFIYNKSVLSRMVIDVTGQFQHWLGNGQGWNSLWLQPRDLCEIYGACGEFSVCSQDQNLLPSCTCLTGFQPKSQKGLVVNNWNFGGCERKIALRCGKEGFLLVSRMKLPDNSRLMAVSSSEECKAECLSNCSCIAYAFPNPGRCLVWGGNLIDLRETVDGGHDLYLRLNNQELNASKKGFTAHKMMLIIIPIVGIIALVIGIILFWRWKAKKDGKKKRSQELSSFEFGSSMVRTNNSADVHNVGQVKMNGPELPLLSFNSVAAATQDFSLANKLGEGGFGPVYKGKLPNGQEIAVKRLSRSSHQGLEEFKNEIVLIAKLQHRNLVRVLGCCIQGEEKILIYEYMPNKSLDSFLFDPTKGALLDWAKRFHIIEGIAQGLLYLHKYSRLRIIHRDLKASNILLDGEMNPRISDFGLARIFGGNETQANTLRVVGTYGYMSPEYALHGRFSVKSDVFSFGVLLLEIISGKKNTGFYQFDQSLNLLGYAWKLWNEGRGLQLLDPSMGDSYITSKVLRCIHVGLLCVQEEVGDRPTMSAIVLMLSNDTTTLPIPKQPNFSLVKIANGMESSSSKQTCSANEMTITMTEGR